MMVKYATQEHATEQLTGSGALKKEEIHRTGPGSITQVLVGRPIDPLETSCIATCAKCQEQQAKARGSELCYQCEKREAAWER
eukprot:481160-Amphidinium_carterae.1